MFVQILGFALFIMGPILVIKTEWFLENVGRIEWAEQHLGGGTRFFFKLLGIAFTFFGLLMMFGLFGSLMWWLFGGLFPGQRPQ
jgi:hypothetical protein